MQDGLASEVSRSPEEVCTSNGLFPASTARRQLEEQLSALLTEAREAVRAGPVRPPADIAEIQSQIEQFAFTRSNDLADVMAWSISAMTTGMVHVNHPRYFGLFNPSPTFASQCAEQIVAAFNPQLASATTSPFPVLLERHVIKAIARRAGMPPSANGHFTTGGSEANATATLCAIARFEPDVAEHGLTAIKGRPTIYVSDQSHLAWLKIAHQTGLGRRGVRLVPSDAQGKMNISALFEMLDADVQNGDVPVMIVSTAGTTGAGAIDPIGAIGAIAHRYGTWHHVDAAWGGAALASDRWRHLIDGIGGADSVTIDAHKWFATTMGCGMFLTADPDILSQVFRVVMPCMPSNDSAVDPYVTTMQWSRRFLGLRLFLGLASAGWAGYGEHIDHAIRMAEVLAEKLADLGWLQLNASPLAVLCMRPPRGSAAPDAIAASVVASGVAWVSSVPFRDELAVRICITSGETSESDLTRLVEALNIASRAAG